MTETLAHGYSSESAQRAIQLIPTCQGLNDCQKYLRSYALGKSSICSVDLQ